MMRPKLHGVILSLLLACSGIAAAQESGYWRAASKNATAITGDVGLANEKISINFTQFTMSQIRALTTDEITAAFDLDQGVSPVGHLYRLDIPGSKKFLHKNTLCGSEDTQWMASFIVGRNLELAFFSGARQPVFTREAIANSTDLCGTFTYAR